MLFRSALSKSIKRAMLMINSWYLALLPLNGVGDAIGTSVLPPVITDGTAGATEVLTGLATTTTGAVGLRDASACVANMAMNW